MKYTPGSAEVHADAMILSQISRALTVLCLTTLPPSSFQRLILPSQRSRYNGSELSGNTKSQGWSSLTACMKSSVIPTEILALVILPASFLELIKSMTSGCQTLRINIKAPRREPPCSIRPVTKLYKEAQDTAPDERPVTPFT